MLNIEQLSAAAAATNDGLFVPVDDLPGLDATELDGTPEGESKLIFAILNAVYDTLNPVNFDKLGFGVTKPNPTGTGADLINQSFGLSAQYMANLADNTIGMIPVPASGTNAEVGKIALTDIFPGADEIASGATSGGAGIVIPDSEIGDFGAPTADTIGDDFRQYLASLYLWMIGSAAIRGSAPSAIVNASVGAATGFNPPAAWTADTNPVSGIDAADLSRRAFFSRQFSLTVNLKLNQADQTFDVNHVS